MSLASGQATSGSDLLRCTMPTLFWDIETRSVVSLETAGASRYASDPTTEILCVGYAIDDNDPKIWLLFDPIPPEIETATHVVAHNFQFERAILTHKLEPLGWPRIPLERQRCSMTLCLVNALPGALDNAATALGIPLQKDREGYKLMRKMSRPLPRRKGDPPDFIRWHDDPKDRERLYDYCRRDVAVERLLFRALPTLPASEQAVFALDAVINQRGFHVDVALAQAARNIARNERLAINAEINAHTDGAITSVDQVAK